MVVGINYRCMPVVTIYSKYNFVVYITKIYRVDGFLGLSDLLAVAQVCPFWTVAES